MTLERSASSPLVLPTPERSLDEAQTTTAASSPLALPTPERSLDEAQTTAAASSPLALPTPERSLDEAQTTAAAASSPLALPTPERSLDEAQTTAAAASSPLVQNTSSISIEVSPLPATSELGEDEMAFSQLLGSPSLFTTTPAAQLLAEDSEMDLSSLVSEVVAEHVAALTSLPEASTTETSTADHERPSWWTYVLADQATAMSDITMTAAATESQSTADENQPTDNQEPTQNLPPVPPAPQEPLQDDQRSLPAPQDPLQDDQRSPPALQDEQQSPIPVQPIHPPQINVRAIDLSLLRQVDAAPSSATATRTLVPRLTSGRPTRSRSMPSTIGEFFVMSAFFLDNMSAFFLD